MKKIVSLLAAAAMVLVLAGCRHSSDSPDPGPANTLDSSDTLAASATNAAAANTPPASASDTQQTRNASAPTAQTTQDAYELARACIGLPVEELYAAVGQPTGTPTYGPSCLQMDAEDGMLPYDGFSVWTVRSATAETVHDVYLNE